ncbi:transcriptional regulator with GAF, ATPase, and Fis domain [Paraburkholderia youngii]
MSDAQNQEANQTAAQSEESETKDFRSAVTEFERNLVLEALIRNRQNWAAVARELGLDRANLNRLAKRLGLK